MTDSLDNFPDFAAAVRQRLEQGRTEYGDRSFDAPVSELLGEIREELLDVCGWTYVTLQRIERLQAATDDKPSTRPTVAEREPEAPYVASLHGIPLTAEEHAGVQRLAANEPITAALVWAVKQQSAEGDGMLALNRRGVGYGGVRRPIRKPKPPPPPPPPQGGS